MILSVLQSFSNTSSRLRFTLAPAAKSTFHLCKDIYVLDIYRKNSHILIK